MEFLFGLLQARGSKSSTSSVTLIFLYSVLCMWTSVECWSYFSSNETMNWPTARRWCQTHYTDMVAIQNQEEIKHLNNLMPKKAKYYWIGIRKIQNVWTWVGTNKALTKEATSWAQGEPNNGKNGKRRGVNEDCVEMYIKRDMQAGKWNDEKCGNMKTALCYKAACQTDSCHHGECVETIDSHKCECFEGFHGEKCEHVVQCKEDEVTSPDKGSVLCSHEYGEYSYASLCQYSCEEGYQQSAPGQMKCTVSGEWSQQPPTCELMQCEALSRPARGSIQCVDPLGSSSYQSTCVFTCEEGYELAASQSSTLQCEASGLWNDSQPLCVAVRCPALQELENGTVSCAEGEDKRHSYGSSCSFICSPGYRLVGASAVTCTSAAEWSEKAPRCEAIICPNPDAEAHLTSQCSHPLSELQPDATCTFSCDAGYELRGAHTIQCSEDGQWNTEIPTCKALECPTPVIPSGGQITCALPSLSSTVSIGAPHPQGSICTFSCDHGYEPQGELSMECDTSGRWSSAPPTCTAVTCPLLDAPVNGQINCTDTELIYNSQCSFTCSLDHVLHGQEVVTCGGHGNWTAEQPTCIASPAPLIEPAAIGAAAGGAVSLSALSLVYWLLKRMKANKFELNSNSDIEGPPQVYKNSTDSLI
ncbi:E-selectin [Genypterus blacodes]|uniref:E-selectin n=1 Tax=Genypterus blacodes TaxID=154954 RepID=UPI003F768C57